MDLCPVCQAQISKLTGKCPLCTAPRRAESDESASPAPPVSSGWDFAKGLTLLLMLGAAVGAALIAGKPYTLQDHSRMIAPPPPVEAPPPPPPPPPPEWRISGRTYDLLSLKSVPEAKISFTHARTGETFRAKTDAAGNFEIILPPVSEGGYKVSVSRKGYSKDFLEEMDPPYHSQSLSRRKDSLELLSQSAMLHVPILLGSPREGARYDMALITED